MTELYFYQSMSVWLPGHPSACVSHRELVHTTRFATLGRLLLGTVFILRVSPGGWTGIHKENIKFPVNS